MGKAPIFIAAERNLVSIAKILLQNVANVNIKDVNLNTTLHTAAEYGYLEMVEMLITKGAEIAGKDYLGRTPLHRADEKTTEILIQNGAKVDAIDKRGDTPIHQVSNPWHGKSKVLKLMRYGASLKIRNKNGLTPVECALKEIAIYSFDVRMPYFKAISYNEMM